MKITLRERAINRHGLVAKGKKGPDYLLAVAVIFLALFGIVMIYSASNYTAKETYGDAFFFVKKQAVGVVGGIALFIVFALFDYHHLKKFALPLYFIGVLLLVLVFVPGISKESYGAKRWIRLFGFTVQPSEIAKFAYILFFASYASKKAGRIHTFRGILVPLLAGGTYLLLILLEPNLSITVCFALLVFALLFLGGTKFRNLLFLVIPALLAVPLLIIAEPYRLKRLSAFLDPWANPKGEGYQLLQSLYAIGSGGWFGVGLFRSRQKYRFLPFAESDFILSVIAEELGFVGTFAVFALIGFIVWRGFRIAKRSKDYFGFLLAVGITVIFGIQCIINALVVTGTIPPTGLPLPLISSGNTAILVFMAEFGVLFNVSAQGERL
ncbi:MAG: putative lipid II flippase FtsW [Clostridia bacterium]|nr:putative lipid II flippase FtsW [Clostridia bacterium]